MDRDYYEMYYYCFLFSGHEWTARSEISVAQDLGWVIHCHFLFLLCGEGLSSLMRLATREGLLKRVRLVGMVCRFHICYLQMILSYLGKQQEEGHSYSKTFYKNIDFSRVNV